MDDLRHLITRCRSHGVTLDTNVFLLAVVGSSDPRLIGRVKRVSQYSVEDYKLLSRLLMHFQQVFITPGVLAETCNLLDSENKRRNNRFFDAMKSLMERLKEHHTPAASLMAEKAFRWIGFTDSSVIELARKGCLVISDELPLKTYLERQSFPVVNFTALRTTGWVS